MSMITIRVNYDMLHVNDKKYQKENLGERFNCDIFVE